MDEKTSALLSTPRVSMLVAGTPTKRSEVDGSPMVLYGFLRAYPFLNFFGFKIRTSELRFPEAPSGGSRSRTIVYVRSAPKADKRAHVSRCPLCAISGREQSQQGSALFDHLVRAREQYRRHVEAERLGGLEIDHQLVLRGSLHRELCRLLALEDAVDVSGGTAI
jgi:hypothetical protein